MADRSPPNSCLIENLLILAVEAFLGVGLKSVSGSS